MNAVNTETRTAPSYEELSEAARILNSGATRAVLLEGNVDDLFYDAKASNGKGGYVPLVDLLSRTWDAPQRIVITYQRNGPIRFENGGGERLLQAWLRVGKTKEAFKDAVSGANAQPSVALEALRQFCLISRIEINGVPILPHRLVVIMEGMELIIPQGDPSRLSEGDRHRAAICRDWITDPGFLQGHDMLIMLAESRGSLNELVAKLPQLMSVNVAAPNEERRRHCIEWFNAHENAVAVAMPNGMDLAGWTAGLSIHALMQLMRGARYAGGEVSPKNVIRAVEAYIKTQLGDDVVEFKKPTHFLKNTVGNAKLKHYLVKEFIPRCKARDTTALTGAIVSGPIGVGKTFVFEAVAAELDMPVLVLKQVRSQWYGQTDVIIARLRRLLNSLSKALIFVDEADAQFGDISTESHSTEKRATGQFLQMMSDPALKGKILWLLMTARVHLLPPDMMRPGRVGDLSLLMLDPEGNDLTEFINGMLTPALADDFDRAKPTEVPGAAALQTQVKKLVQERNRFTIWEWTLFSAGFLLSGSAVGLSNALPSPWRFWTLIPAAALFVGIGILLAVMRRRRKHNAASTLAQVEKKHPVTRPFHEVIVHLTKGYSPATFMLLRSELQVARLRKGSALDHGEILAVIQNVIPAEIEKTRRYQTLQALLHCTRRSLLPPLEGNDLDAHRTLWRREIAELEREGIR